MKRKIKVDDIVFWKSGRKTLYGQVLEIDGDTALVSLRSEELWGEERSLPLSGLTYEPPVILTVPALRQFSRFEITYAELMQGRVYAGIEIPEPYQIVPDDLKTAVINYHKSGLDEDGFGAEYFWMLWDEIYDGVGMETALSGPDEDADDQMTVPNQYSVFGNAWQIFIDKYYHENEDANLDDVITEVQIWEDNKDKPLLEREFSLAQKKDFLEFWDDDQLELADEDIKAVYRKILDGLCEEDDTDALQKKAYACYGNGNAAYGQNWPESMKCLLRLMEIDPNPQTANTLGYMYYYGRCTDGVPEYDKAFYYFSIGAAGWYYESRYKLSDMFIHGYGVAKNPKAAAAIIWELYEEQLKKIRYSDFRSNFADVALRAGNLCKDGIDCAANPYNAFYFYLQARYAIHMRMLTEDNYGDQKIAAGIDEAIAQVLPQTLYEKPCKTVRFYNLENLLRYGLRKRHHLEMTVHRTSDTKARLIFRTVPYEDEKHAPKLLITVPPAHYCSLVGKVSVKAEKIETLQTVNDSDTVLFDSIYGDELYLYGKKVAEIDAEFIFKVPKHDRKKHSFVSVTFTPGGKRYDYLSDIPLQPGDRAVVETVRGESVVTVEAVFEKAASELAMPVEKYKKILRAYEEQ